MAFAVKYRMDWIDRLGQLSYRIDVEKDNYAGAIIILGHTVDGFELVYNEKDWVQGFEGTFSFHLQDIDTAAYDADFYDSQYKQFKVKFYINSVLKNVGWLKPENTTRELLGPTVQYRVSFTDALLDLEKIDYTGYENTGFQTILQVIKNALAFGGIEDLNFAIQCNLYEDELMTESENLFKFFRINNGAFYDVKEGETTAENCYTVLERCVKPFYCRLNQVDGYWQITNGGEYTSQRDIYAYSNLVPVSENTPYGRTVSITQLHVEGSKLQLSKVPPVKDLRTTWRNKKLGTNILTNGDFSTPGTPPPGWDNHPGEQRWTVFIISNNRLSLVETPATAPNVKKSFSSIPFNVASIGEGKGYFYLSFKINLKNITYTTPTLHNVHSNPPLYDVRLTYPPNLAGVSQVKEEIGNFYQLGEATYMLRVPESWPVSDVGNYILTFIFHPPNFVDPQAHITLIDLEIDDIMLTHTAIDKGETTDILSTHSSTSGIPGYLTLDEDLYFADGTQLSDAGILIDTASNFSKSWTRWSKVPVEKVSLISQFSRQFLNDRRGYFDRISVSGLIDMNEQIHFNSILLLNSKKYRFIDFSKNYKRKTISGTIQQVDSDTDLGFSAATKSLFSQFGIPFRDLKRMLPPGRGVLGSLLDSSSISFKGSIGIGGIKKPSAYLHLPAGGTLPGTAPLKIDKSTGGRMTTAEEGAVEHYTEGGKDRLTMTINNVRYEMTNREFLETINTSGSVITFDMGKQTKKYLKATHNLQHATTWEFINDQNFVTGKFKFLVTAILDHTFPSNVTMSDSRFDEATRKWRPNDLGEYEANFFYDGFNYQIDIFGPYRNLNKPPEIVNNVITYNSGTNTLDGARTYFDLESDLENNPLPQALDILISGTAEVGSLLTLTYTFFSPSGYTFSLANIQWYRANEDGTNESVIPGAVSTTYTTAIDDIGKLIYCKITVIQTATAPANGNPNSIEYTSPSKLIGESVLVERFETLTLSSTFVAELNFPEPPVAWADKILVAAGSIASTFNTDVNPAVTNLGTAANWTTVDATKPFYNAANKTLEFRNAHRVSGTTVTHPPVYELWIKGKFTAANGWILSQGNQCIFGNNSSNQYVSNGLTPQAGDLNEHVFRIRMDGINSKFQVDNGTVITFDENTTVGTLLVLGQTNSAGNSVDFDLKSMYRTAHGSLMTTQEIADMWAHLGY